MKQLFQYCVIYDEHKEDKDGDPTYVDSILIVEPKFALAKSEKELAFKATREVDEKYASDPEHVRILIRNF